MKRPFDNLSKSKARPGITQVKRQSGDRFNDYAVERPSQQGFSASAPRQSGEYDWKIGNWLFLRLELAVGFKVYINQGQFTFQCLKTHWIDRLCWSQSRCPPSFHQEWRCPSYLGPRLPTWHPPGSPPLRRGWSRRSPCMNFSPSSSRRICEWCPCPQSLVSPPWGRKWQHRRGLFSGIQAGKHSWVPSSFDRRICTELRSWRVGLGCCWGNLTSFCRRCWASTLSSWFWSRGRGWNSKREKGSTFWYVRQKTCHLGRRSLISSVCGSEGSRDCSLQRVCWLDQLLHYLVFLGYFNHSLLGFRMTASYPQKTLARIFMNCSLSLSCPFCSKNLNNVDNKQDFVKTGGHQYPPGSDCALLAGMTSNDH